MLVGSSSCGISVQTPSPPYCHPWYGHMIRSPTTRPSESAVPRWMQRSRSACGGAGGVAPEHEVLAEQPHAQRRVAQRVGVRDGCQQPRSAAKSGTEAGGCSITHQRSESLRPFAISLTSMLPRVALEYGQTWWAARTTFSAAVGLQLRQRHVELDGDREPAVLGR